jgi:hypothetical protein
LKETFLDLTPEGKTLVGTGCPATKCATRSAAVAALSVVTVGRGIGKP